MQNLTNVIAISAGVSHTVALRADGTVWAWGSNSSGQLGDNTITARHTPVQVQNLTNVIAISAGGSHTVALRADGTVWAWGNNLQGRLGDGTTTIRRVPVQVSNLANVIEISAGINHNIALRSDGTVWTWGSNSSGQLGDPTTGWSSLLRTQVWGAGGDGYLNLHISQPPSGSTIPRAVAVYSPLGCNGELECCCATIQLRATVFPLIANQTVVWDSSAPDLIDVDQMGLVQVVKLCCCIGGSENAVSITATAVTGTSGSFDVWAHPRIVRAFDDDYYYELELNLEESRLPDDRSLDSLYYECFDDCVHEYDGFVRQNTVLVAECIDCEHADESIYECCCEMDISEAITFTRDIYDIWENQIDVHYFDGGQAAVMIDEEAGADAYIAFNQLTSGLVPGMMAIYTYRADGLRHSKTVDGVTTTHVWIGNNIVLERNASGAVINRFDRSLTGRLIRSEQHGYYLHNKRGDVVQRVNAQGDVLRNYRYTAFGVELSSDEANCNPFRFMGEYWDAATGTYYLRARNFNPQLGRFLSADPYFGIHNMQFGSNPVERNGRFMPDPWAIIQAGNLYMFVMHNPVRFLDPLGLNAILLTDTGRNLNRPNTEANPFGHTALAIQNRDTGNWYIMDFRALDNSPKSGNDKATVIFAPLQNIQWGANERSIISAEFSFPGVAEPLDVNRYNRQLFIAGDFQASWDMAYSMKGTTPGFHFTTNNCVWQAIHVLQASTVGTSAYANLNNILWTRQPTPHRRGVKSTIIPTVAVGQVQRAVRNDFSTSLWTAPLVRRSIQYIFN